MHSLTLLLISGMLLTLFSACAPTRYPPGYHGQGSANADSASGGYVKRGKPYQIEGKWYYPLASGDHYDETGVASWYGKKFHGRKTANGEVYNMYAMTAAHTTLPLPATVLVTNLDNGKQVKVRVNDRGPFVKNRLIDLSYSAAKALGYATQGTARVRVQTLDVQADVPAVSVKQPLAARPNIPAQVAPSVIKQAYVQVGAFSVKEGAENVAGHLKPYLNANHPPLRVLLAANVYRVRLGPFALDDDAMKALEHVKSNGYAEAMIIHD